MRIGEVFDRIYDEEVGWRPVTGAIKPVHVANGMFRALTGRQHDISRIISFIVWWRKKNEKLPHEERTFEKLVAEQPEGPFACFRADHRRFDRARDFTRAVLGADGAVFPDPGYSSLTLTCREMISSDPNDRGLGLFAAALVQGPAGDGPLAAVLRGALETEEPDDPVTTLVWPLLDRIGRAAPAVRPRGFAYLETHCREYLDQLRGAADDLASHERDQGNRLRTLQRAVHFACVSAQSHVQALVTGGQLADRVPALISARAPKGSAITNASESTLALIHERFEAWLRDRLAARLAEGAPLHQGEAIPIAGLHDDGLAQILTSIGPQHQGSPTDREMQLRLEDLEEARRLYGDSEAARTLAHALWCAYRREYSSGGPREYLARIGRWTGLIYPHFQGATRDKRVRPSVPLLDMMVRACVPRGRMVALEEFLERLWLRFGLIVGGRGDGQEDAALLRRHGLDLDATLLVSNTEHFIDQLVAIGLARRFADNVAFVGDGYAE